MMLVLEGTEEDFAQHGLEETHDRMGAGLREARRDMLWCGGWEV